MGTRIILRGGSRGGYEDYIYTDQAKYPDGEIYRLTSETDAQGRRVATPDKVDTATVGRRVSEWANSPAGRKAIMEDEGSCEAGIAHPEAPNRFYVSHGVIHDKMTGRHVRTCDCVQLDGGVEDACALLNDLAGPFNSKQGGIPKSSSEIETK